MLMVNKNNPSNFRCGDLNSKSLKPCGSRSKISALKIYKFGVFFLTIFVVFNEGIISLFSYLCSLCRFFDL